MSNPKLDYREFLKAKVKMADEFGFDIAEGEINPVLKPHQRDIVRWMVRMGRAACFAAFGLGKSVIQLEVLRIVLSRCDASDMGLIVIPLGVRQEFIRDAAMLGIKIKFIRRLEECDGGGLYLTNYETVRDGKLDPTLFRAASLDEAAILSGFGGTKTFREFMATFAGDRKTMNQRTLGQAVEYRFVATATPSPNEYIELLAYSAFLGVMDIGGAKTRFFKRDSTKADVLTLHAHKEREFWLWVASWAIFVQKPSDLGHSDDGYSLPDMEINWHEIPSNHAEAGVDFRGQGLLIKEQAIGVVNSAREKRGSLDVRIEKIVEIINGYREQADLQQQVLCDEQGKSPSSGFGTLSQGSGAEDGLHEGISKDISETRKVARAERRGKQEASGKVCAGREFSGENQETGKELAEAKPGEKASQSAESGLRSGAWPIRADFKNAGRGMCDLRSQGDRSIGKKQEGEKAFRGSLSCDREDSRPALSSLQLRYRPFQGQSGPAPESDCLPDQIVIWCDLNDEQKAIEKTLQALEISYSSLHGSQDIEGRTAIFDAWKNKETSVFLSKPSMFGSGANLQQSHTMIFAGIGFKFREFFQAIHRVHRFLQEHRCSIHFIYTESEREVRRTLERKWEQHKLQVQKMTEIINEFGLSTAAMAETLTRAMGVERIEVTGKDFRIINNDCILEARDMPNNSLDMILTSVPFSTQYEYSPNYADFGHSDNNAHFFEQMDYLTPELLRTLKPGRVAAIHVKDRIVPGGLTGLGYQTVYPFHAKCIEHYQKHGFGYMGMITVVTDVVRENNQTYRLGWSEVCKDGSKISVGMPEYVLLFRKTPTDTTNAYADEPVTKDKPDCYDPDGNVVPFKRGSKEVHQTGYSRARWQVDAHAFWRSGGDRFLTCDELENVDHDVIFKWFRDYHLANLYNYEHHIKVGEQLDQIHGRLPVTFMLLQPPSWMDDVWTDVARMRTLNMLQSQKGKEQHLCLARGSLVLTRDGYIPIENVEPGDEVLTHLGRWRKVLVARMTGESRGVIELRAQGVAGLRLTPDHKLWTRRADGARAVDAATKAEPEWVEAANTVGHYVNLKLPPIEPSPLTERECWLIGRWLADGHVGTRGDYWVSIGPTKLEEFEQRAGELAGTRSIGTAVQIRLKGLSGAMCATLERCGRGASGKRVPIELLSLGGELACAALDGYLSGDGHLVPSRNRWQASSVSRALLLGIALLAQRAHGTSASLAPGRPAGEAVIQGRTVTTMQEWVLSFDDGANEGRKRPFILKDGAWKRVRSTDAAGESEVWCLTVEDDESFTAEGCIVKNCPMQFDIADRLIERFTNKGEMVFDPFGGIMSVPYRAILKGRKTIACELSTRYFMDGAHYLQAAEREMSMPSLFDTLETV